MPTTAEKLKMLNNLRNPNAAMMDIMSQLLSNVQIMKGDKGDKGDMPQKGKDYFTEQEIRTIIEIVLSQIPVPSDGKDGARGEKGERGPKGDSVTGPAGKDGKDGKNGKDGKDAKQIDTQKLIDEAIKALMESTEWKDMNKKILYNKYDQRWHGGGSGESVLIYDLTSQCDGITKTFTVPAHTRAIKLEGTQFPIIYRPTTDWTTAGTTLTLGSGVGAPETDQTLLFYYVA